jgi:hypothetical protein
MAWSHYWNTFHGKLDHCLNPLLQQWALRPLLEHIVAKMGTKPVVNKVVGSKGDLDLALPPITVVLWPITRAPLY